MLCGYVDGGVSFVITVIDVSPELLDEACNNFRIGPLLARGEERLIAESPCSWINSRARCIVTKGQTSGVEGCNANVLSLFRDLRENSFFPL